MPSTLAASGLLLWLPAGLAAWLAASTPWGPARTDPLTIRSDLMTVRVMSNFAELWRLLPVLGAVGLLCSCGESPNPPGSQDHTLGGVPTGAPLGPAVADPGILQDATTYQPPKLALAAAAAPAGEERTKDESAVTPARPDAPVRAAVTACLNAIKDGEVDLALRAFDADQVKLLREKIDVLQTTFEKLQTLQTALNGKLDQANAAKVLNPLRGGGEDAIKCELVDPEHASVTPNPAAALLGPKKATPTLRMGLVGGDWKFQLDSPLTAEDVDTVVKYQTELQTSLDSIMAWANATPTIDMNQLKAAIDKAKAGEPVELGGEPGAKPAEGAEAAPAKPGGEEQPEPPQPPRPGGGGGRGRPPGG